MIKKTLSLLIGLILLSTFVLAVPSPEPVAVQVNLVGYPDPEGLKLIHTNIRTGISYESEVDSSGFSLMEWGNNPHLPGDKVVIAIKVCKDNPACVKTITLDGEPLFVDLDVPTLIEIQKEVIKEVGYKYVCADKSIKDTAEECPEIQRIIVPSEVLVCPSGEKVVSANDCPQDPWVLVSVVIGLVAAGLLALYLKDKKKYKWAPGLAGILKAKLAKAKKLKEEGKEAAALKELQSAEKTANTVLKKYLTEELKK